MKLVTALADRLCSHANAPTLRPFTKEDWYGYAGCESEVPEIGSTDAVEVVLDGSSVTATVSDPNGADQYAILIHAAEFPSPSAARLVALAILADPSQTASLLGEAVGS